MNIYEYINNISVLVEMLMDDILGDIWPVDPGGLDIRDSGLVPTLLLPR